MLAQLLPQRFDHAYRGYRVALWLFAFLVCLKSVISLNSILNGELVAQSADGIPLDAYPPAAASTIVSLFALLGLSRLMMCVLSLLVLIRYRAMVPLMFALFLIEHLGRRLILELQPIARTGTSPASAINLVLFACMLIGLVLSLRRRDVRDDLD